MFGTQMLYPYVVHASTGPCGMENPEYALMLQAAVASSFPVSSSQIPLEIFTKTLEGPFPSQKLNRHLGSFVACRCTDAEIFAGANRGRRSISGYPAAIVHHYYRFLSLGYFNRCVSIFPYIVG